MNTYSFRTIIEPDKPNGYHGFVPALKGVHTCGKTIDEVKKKLERSDPLSYRRIIKGWNSSHIQLKHSYGRRTTVPYHASHEIKRGTLKGIIDDLNISVDKFVNLVKQKK